MRLKTIALLSLALLAVGCSSNDTKEPEPAELTKFDAEVQLKKEWSRSIGDGQGETYNRLTPVVYGDQIYAADINGRVVSMDRITGKVNWRKDLDVSISGAVGAGYGLVLVGTLRGEVLALDVSTGEERWRSQVSSEVLA
nr:PQQ-binding-like beta-propeller repeat protein [Pseudomonas sp.]